MAESLCRMCPISAVRILRRTGAGVVAVPEQTVRPGHVMVVSARHASSFSDLSQADADAFMALVGTAARAAEGASGAERYYVIRIGDKAPHLHFHLVPRAEGEPSLAPHVFGETGWAAHVRRDATPPSDVFDPTFSRDLRIEEIRTRPKEDPGRLPAWLVRAAISMVAFLTALAIAEPFGDRNIMVASGTAAMMAAQHLTTDRMSGRPLRWAPALPMGLAAGLLVYAMFRWLP